MGAPRGNKNAAGPHTGSGKRRKKEEKGRAWIRKNTPKAKKAKMKKSPHHWDW